MVRAKLASLARQSLKTGLSTHFLVLRRPENTIFERSSARALRARLLWLLRRPVLGIFNQCAAPRRLSGQPLRGA